MWPIIFKGTDEILRTLLESGSTVFSVDWVNPWKVWKIKFEKNGVRHFEIVPKQIKMTKIYICKIWYRLWNFRFPQVSVTIIYSRVTCDFVTSVHAGSLNFNVIKIRNPPSDNVHNCTHPYHMPLLTVYQAFIHHESC